MSTQGTEAGTLVVHIMPSFIPDTETEAERGVVKCSFVGMS